MKAIHWIAVHYSEYLGLGADRFGCAKQVALMGYDR